MKKVLFIIGIGFMILIAYGLFMYFQPVKDISKQSSDISLTQKQLTDDFSSDAVKADIKYKNKIIEISGIVKNTEMNDSTNSLIFDEGGNFIIIANGDVKDRSSFVTLKSGTKVVVKGIYSGYVIMDDTYMIPAEIKMDRCYVIK